MGLKETKLSKIIESAYQLKKADRLSYGDFYSSSYFEEITNTYNSLGGASGMFPTRYRYDIQSKDFIVELDEENHFNRYRKATLSNSSYQNLRTFSLKDYISYCDLYENKCRRDGKFGDNPSAKGHFSSKALNIVDIGFSRWKQRAFYDYLKDIAQSIQSKPLVRLSIYEEIDGYTIGKILDNAIVGKYNEVLDIIESRLVKQTFPHQSPSIPAR